MTAHEIWQLREDKRLAYAKAKENTAAAVVTLNDKGAARAALSLKESWQAYQNLMTRVEDLRKIEEAALKDLGAFDETVFRKWVDMPSPVPPGEG